MKQHGFDISPSEIDEEFCISWNMAEWEDEEENAETEES